MRLVSSIGPPHYGAGSGILEAFSGWNYGEVALTLELIRWHMGIRYSAEVEELERR